MKKVTTMLIACISLFGMNLNAQEDYRGNLKFGLKAGANYSNVWDEQDNDFEANGKAGFAGGAFLHIPIGKFLGVQPEVYSLKKGFRAPGQFSDKSTHSNVQQTTWTYQSCLLLSRFRHFQLLQVRNTLF